MSGLNFTNKEMRDDPAPNTTTRYSNAQVEFKRVSRRMDRVPVAPGTRQESYICCKQNTRLWGQCASESSSTRESTRAYAYPGHAPERDPARSEEGTAHAAAAAGHESPVGTPTPAQRLRSRTRTHPVRRQGPAESEARPQPGWSYYHSPPSGDRRWDHGACPITGS